MTVWTTRLAKAFLTALALFMLPVAADAAKKEPTVEERYARGEKHMKRGYYVKALEEFNRIRNYHRQHPLAVKAELAIADVYFKKSEWDQARVAYQDFIRMHPRHVEMDYVTYKMGLTSYKKSPRVSARDQTWTRQAVNAWTGFLSRFPESEYAEEVDKFLTRARNRLAQKEYDIGTFYARREAWAAVEVRMEGMLRHYGDSPDVPSALAYLVLAQHRQGHSVEAQESLSRLQTDYPDDPSLGWLGRRAPELF